MSTPLCRKSPLACVRIAGAATTCGRRCRSRDPSVVRFSSGRAVRIPNRRWTFPLTAVCVGWSPATWQPSFVRFPYRFLLELRWKMKTRKKDDASSEHTCYRLWLWRSLCDVGNCVPGLLRRRLPDSADDSRAGQTPPQSAGPPPWPWPGRSSACLPAPARPPIPVAVAPPAPPPPLSSLRPPNREARREKLPPVDVGGWLRPASVPGFKPTEEDQRSAIRHGVRELHVSGKVHEMVGWDAPI